MKFAKKRGGLPIARTVLVVILSGGFQTAARNARLTLPSCPNLSPGLRKMLLLGLFSTVASKEN